MHGGGHEGQQHDMWSTQWMSCISIRLHTVQALQAAARVTACRAAWLCSCATSASCIAHLQVLLHLPLRLRQDCLRSPAVEQHTVRSTLDDAPACSREQDGA